MVCASTAPHVQVDFVGLANQSCESYIDMWARRHGRMARIKERHA